MIKKIAAECSRLFIGIVFIFSGVVKAIDPVGGAYKFQDYFTAFGLERLLPFTLTLSFCLAAVEFTLGVCLLLGVYRRYTTSLVLLFMLFMTPLTLYLALANPVSDCGCFGDALIITNWQTFFKNIVLLSAAIIVFIYNQKLLQCYSYKVYWFVALFAYLYCIGFAYANDAKLPLVDFRPYKVGANIPALMTIPEGAPQAEERYSFIYEKDGVKKEFSLENYPQDDSTWTFVEQKTTVLKSGYEPPITNFSVTTSDGVDITDELLHNKKGVLLLISPKLEKASDTKMDRLNGVYDFAAEFGYSFYCLTASTPDKIEEWIASTGAEYPFAFTDEITLKTIVRSNPGLILLKNGIVLQKWAHGDLPEDDLVQQEMEGYLSGKIVNTKEDGRVVTNLLSFTIPLLLVWGYDYLRNRRKRKSLPDSTPNPAKKE